MPPTQIVDAERFSKVMFLRSVVLRSTADHFKTLGAENFQLTRPLLGVLLQESSQLEELLDAYGARINQKWSTLRLHVATIKNFSTAGYDLLHLCTTIQNYDFQGDHPFFRSATEDAVELVTAYIYCALMGFLRDTEAFTEWPPPESLHGYDFSEELPPGRLPKDRKASSDTSAQQLITQLATDFLNQTEDAAFLQTADLSIGPHWKGLNFDLLTEATFLILEGKFHTMQSLYDTYISYSEMEGNDTSLRALRGHISVVLHLLKVATVFIHFYERHLKIQSEKLFCHTQCVLSGNWYMEVFTHYLCHYAYEFLASARGLCQKMLKNYAVIETCEVPVPPYAGFHVRPSALISKIAEHYNSKVVMILGGVEYDCMVSMNLWRANEYLNQLKRDYVATQVLKHGELLRDLQRQLDAGETTKVEAARVIVRMLAKEGIVKVLKYPMPLEPIIESSSAPTLVELLQTICANLMGRRQITVPFPVKAQFRGDKRVLQDIQLLAKNTYCETEEGVNLPIPPALAYLNTARKGRF
ncbi:MAG: hypothetical protein J6Y80_06575 [Victivallales bacterium]|nr:hypothetical protein [Victivallales bacterium]